MSAPRWIRGPDGKTLKWEGGRIKEGKGGKQVFVIERQVAPGLRRSIALNANSIDDARVQLSRFEEDEVNYRTPRAVAVEKATRAGAVVLDPDTTLAEFKKHCDARVKKEELTDQYVKQILVPYLAQWAKALNGQDLRKVELGTLKTLHRRWKTAKHKRVVALKAFTAWMREEGTEDGTRLHRNEDPTLDLKTPEIIPAKSVKAKGYPMPLVEALYARIPDQLARDTILLRAKTGMHDTEIARVAAGKAELRRVADPSGIEGVIVFAHLKKGKMHAVSVDAPTFAAAERLQTHGKPVLRPILKRLVDKACEAMSKELKREVVIHPGELRHSFATWATTVGREVHAVNQKGVDLTKVAENMGHLGKRTTAVFYVGDRVPMMIAIPVRLEHPEDPKPMKRAEAKTADG